MLTLATLPLRRYAQFSGRARRAEYWLFQLLSTLILLVAFGLAVALEVPAIGLVALVALALPSLAVAVRRLHDTGRSGWFLLLNLVPIANILLLVFFVSDSEHGPNAYGPNPKL